MGNPRKLPDLRVHVAGEYGTPHAVAAANPEVGTEHSVRYDIKKRATNGLAKEDAIRRVGTKFLIHVERYVKWKLSHSA